MCKRCSRYIDMKDYVINSAVSKNFKTKGSFVIEPKGYVFNTEAIVREAVIKGRFLGKLFAEHSLTIYSTRGDQGQLSRRATDHSGGESFSLGRADQDRFSGNRGELAADLLASETVVLKSTARLFGDVEAANLVVEEGAVIVGRVRVGRRGNET